MDALHASITRLEDWFVNSALPLWVERGYDHARGGFYETLDFAGEPVAGQPRRVRVQARQIYTLSKAGMRGWHAQAEALAAKGFDYFLARACPDGGARGCVHIISDDGAILDDRRDLYDQAFLLLACSARWAAARDARALKLAEKTIVFLDEELASPVGGWFESDKRELPRRQNPHMHLFEAFMALFEATGEERYIKYADKIFDLFTMCFYDVKTGFIREFFDENLQPIDHEQPYAIEPGHMMEWVWLLGSAMCKKKGRAELMNKLYANAREFGCNRAGFLIDNIVPGADTGNANYRLWPQTEYIKAALTLARDGNDKAARHAATMIDQLFNTYLDQKTLGLWCDQYDGRGAAIAADVPASILYHLFEAVANAANFKKGSLAQ